MLARDTMSQVDFDIAIEQVAGTERMHRSSGTLAASCAVVVAAALALALAAPTWSSCHRPTIVAVADSVAWLPLALETMAWMVRE